MVQEVRKIVFSGDELLGAYESYRRMTPGFLPHGKITECKASDDGTVIVYVQTLDGAVEHFSMHGMDILRPMIRFCIENNVILPRDGRKSLSLAEGTATLCISLNLHVDMRDAFIPMQTCHMNELTEVLPDPAIKETLAVVTA